MFSLRPPCLPNRTASASLRSRHRAQASARLRFATDAASRKCCNFQNGDGGRPERNRAAKSQAARSNSFVDELILFANIIVADPVWPKYSSHHFHCASKTPTSPKRIDFSHFQPAHAGSESISPRCPLVV